MKIKKLTESVKLVEEDELNPIEASTAEAAKDIIEGGDEAGVEITPEQAKKEAEHAKNETRKYKVNVYASTAKLSEVTQKLQACLEAADQDRQNGIDSDYPDMLIYGLAGFGKTAGVRQFCIDHDIYMLSLDAKTLRQENLAGIPKAVTDKDGNEFQAAVPLPIWTELKKHDGVILVIDEVNRAKPNITGTLLELICNHDLPIPHLDEEGNWQTKTHYDNILFTVCMINPASRDLFADVNELDPAFVDRFAVQHEAKADKREFLGVVKSIYDKIFANPFLLPNDKNKYQGQLDIAEALLTNSGFKFDDRAKAVAAHKAQRVEYRPRDALSYRSLIKVLRLCDGTKADFLKKLKWHGFLPETELMIENCLSSYTDKISKGNNPFQKNVSPAAVQRSAKTSSEVDNILADFDRGLD